MAGKLCQKNEESSQESSPCVRQCNVSCPQSSAQKCQTLISTTKYDIKISAIRSCFKKEYRQCALRHIIARQEVITKCFVSCGISSREVERQVDLFDESTAEDQLAEISKLAGIEYDPESFQHEAAVECFDDYSANWEECLLVNECAEGSNSVSNEEFSDTVCNRHRAKLSTRGKTLGKIDELIINSDAMINELVRIYFLN
ncbi:hypothetical protein AVEN_189862-1 [Araneus ventricosus]|uniref:Uncharacterized protein n=1 Tax=Araneus ventricosus TaxID=182803 RepID=A0A4Y2EG74_ARAVE|nr:hypothetical protein AVEN_189862-1 [Araneus ventricosus]